jgi:hypothetical protein
MQKAFKLIELHKGYLLHREKVEQTMKKPLTVLIIGILCFSMFSVLQLKATAQQSSNGLSPSFPSSSAPASASPSPIYSSGTFPTSIYYQAYTIVGSGQQFTRIVPSGPMAISIGASNGSVAVEVSQNGQTLLSKDITGEYSNYVTISGSSSYSYVNFNSDGLPVTLSFWPISGNPSIAFNMYNNYITDLTARLITYPPQFAANMGPPVTPVNTGLSFLLVAPTYTQPTPLAIWVGEGFNDPQTGQNWWAQIGFNNWAGDMNVSYAGWGIFSNIFGNPGGTDYNYPLIPGDTYNFTMAVVSGTTWEFVVNNTLIQEPALTGLFNTTTTVSNEGAALGLETLSAWGGSIGITNAISIPMVMSFLINGQWTEPDSFQFGSIGENWWNGYATSAPGINLWGLAGHLQDPSVPTGALLFNDSLPIILDTPTLGFEPLYGNYGFPKVSSGGGIVTVTKLSNVALQVTPVNEVAYVSVASSSTSGTNIVTLTDEEINGPTSFTVPAGTTTAAVYAANSLYSVASSLIVNMVPMNNVTFAETGLPPGTIWSITINGTAEYSATNTVSFMQPAGIYSFTAQPNAGWTITPISGILDVSANVTEQISFQNPVAFEDFSSDLSNFAWVGAMACQGDSVLIDGDGYGIFNITNHSYSPILNRPFQGYSLAATSEGNVILVGGTAYTPPGGARLGIYGNGIFTDATSALPANWTDGNMGRVTSIVAIGSSAFFIMGSTNTTVYAGLYDPQSNTFSSLPQLAGNFAVTNGQLPMIVAAYASQLNAVMIAVTSSSPSLGLFFLSNNTYVNLAVPSGVSSVGYAYYGLTGYHGVASDGSSFIVTGSKFDGSGWEALYSAQGIQDLTATFPGGTFNSACWNGTQYALAGRITAPKGSASAVFFYDPIAKKTAYMSGIIPNNWYPTQIVSAASSNLAVIGYSSGANSLFGTITPTQTPSPVIPELNSYAVLILVILMATAILSISKSKLRRFPKI